ncbi:hypothetical protein NDU88_002393 [Pleurodeles waltl]|uniref:Uncharacterized protein n=1 Tax=Pleurodeles waltl TaxID=8319 RepID=A0AAV7SF64_PLEWA|nr:hypothetical protein NDU88_002393 [Pleurodeles waltl]
MTQCKKTLNPPCISVGFELEVKKLGQDILSPGGLRRPSAERRHRANAPRRFSPKVLELRTSEPAARGTRKSPVFTLEPSRRLRWQRARLVLSLQTCFTLRAGFVVQLNLFAFSSREIIVFNLPNHNRHVEDVFFRRL